MNIRGPLCVPNEPLIPFANRVSQYELARRIAAYYADDEFARRVVNRVLQPGTRMTLKVADRICCALGYHPIEIFGRELWEAGLEDELDGPNLDETWEDIAELVELERMAGVPEHGPAGRVVDDLEQVCDVLDRSLR